MRYKPGFTIAEILLSLTLLSIIAGMIIPMYRLFFIRDDLDIATMNVAFSLRRAQVHSVASDGDTVWGVHVGVGGILLFKGISYVGRDQAFDENTSIPTSITIGGINDITFSKVFGLPNATGTITLTSQSNETRTITINEKGMVDY